jgi:SAM-dependent methyltransferase
MCNLACIDFARRHLGRDDVAGKRVLEVGSRAVQSPDLRLRPYLTTLEPAVLLGVDVTAGEGVDRILDAGDLVRELGAASFDVVVCTEVVEHVRDWRRIFRNLKGVLRPGGVLLLTTRSPGFPYHAWPHDYWRYTADDLRRILSDLDVEAIETDPSAPGVLLRARKPHDYAERDPGALRLPTVVGGRRRRLPPSRPRILLHRFAVRARHAGRALARRLGGPPSPAPGAGPEWPR